MFIEPL